MAELDAQIAAKAAMRDLDARRRRGDAKLRNVVSFDTWRERRELGGAGAAACRSVQPDRGQAGDQGPD